MNSVNASFAKLLEYERRAQALSEEGEGADPNHEQWVGIAFRLGSDRLVCSMETVRESLPVPPVTRVPGTKPFILGLANVRGELVTMIDLNVFLGGQRTLSGPKTRMLLASLRGRPIGLMVDEVVGQRNFTPGEAAAFAPTGDSILQGLVRKQHRSGTETWPEFDLDSLFSTPAFLDGAAD